MGAGQFARLNQQSTNTNLALRRFGQEDAAVRLALGAAAAGSGRGVSVVMADLRGFSTAASALPPEDVLRVINHFLEGMTEVIFEYGGTIDEVLGDGLLVLFGAPVLRADDAGRPITLQAFVAIGDDLKQLYQALESRDLAAGSPAARRLFS